MAKTLRENTGEQGLRFFTLVFSLFMFILVANLIGMFARHIALKVFAGFVAALSGPGAVDILPLVMTVALTGLELLMSVMQAYIFAMLTCMISTTRCIPATGAWSRKVRIKIMRQNKEIESKADSS